MRLAKREVVDDAELRSIVERARVVRIGYTDAEGLAIVPMNYGYEWHEAEGAGPTCTFWLHSAAEGRKAEAWAQGASVALELDVEGGVTTGSYACAYSYAYESIMAWGRVEPVADPAEKLRGLGLIMAHMAPGAPASFSDEAVARVAVWRVDVERMTGKRREAKPAGTSHATAPTTPEAPASTPEAVVTHATPTPEPNAPGADAVTAPAPEPGQDAKLNTEASAEAERPTKKKGKDGKKAKKAADSGDASKKDKDSDGKPKKDKKDNRDKPKKKKKDAMPGFLEKLEAKLKGSSDEDELKRKAKADRKAREKAIDEVLKGQRCDGCGHKCKLVAPRCGKGKKLRAKRLARAGLKE